MGIKNTNTAISCIKYNEVINDDTPLVIVVTEMFLDLRVNAIC